jgi:hypothetical protein
VSFLVGGVLKGRGAYAAPTWAPIPPSGCEDIFVCGGTMVGLLACVPLPLLVWLLTGGMLHPCWGLLLSLVGTCCMVSRVVDKIRGAGGECVNSDQ